MLQSITKKALDGVKDKPDVANAVSAFQAALDEAADEAVQAAAERAEVAAVAAAAEAAAGSPEAAESGAGGDADDDAVAGLPAAAGVEDDQHSRQSAQSAADRGSPAGRRSGEAESASLHTAGSSGADASESES